MASALFKASPILIPPAASVEQLRTLVAQKLNDLQAAISAALPPTDFQGQRLTSVARPQQANDAVNLQYLQQQLATLQGGSVPLGAQAIDATVVRFLQRTQPQLAALGTQLGTAGKGTLVWVTDFNHLLQWLGSSWTWGPGEGGSGYIVDFAIAPVALGWHLVDGTLINVMKADGTVATVQLPTLPAYRLGAAAYTSTTIAAAAPTFAGAASGSVGATAGGVSVAPPFTPSGTVSLAGGDPIAHYSAIPYMRI